MSGKESSHAAWFIKFLGEMDNNGSQFVLVKFRGKEYKATMFRREHDRRFMVKCSELPHHPCSYYLKGVQGKKKKQEVEQQAIA